MAGFPSLTEKGEQPLFPKTTCDFAPSQSEQELTSVQGFGAASRLQGLGLPTYPPTSVFSLHRLPFSFAPHGVSSNPG